jgi:DNA-binding XRE family transcriptional regulator
VTALNIVRRRQLYSREALAKVAQVSPSTIYLIEKGKTRPRLGVMRKLATALGVDPMEIDEFREAVESERTRPAA